MLQNFKKAYGVLCTLEIATLRNRDTLPQAFPNSYLDLFHERIFSIKKDVNFCLEI